MKNLSYGICVALTLPLLASCVSVTVDERTAFQPPKRELGPATTVAELDSRMTGRFKALVDEGSVRLDQEPGGGLRVTYLEAYRLKNPSRPPRVTSILTNGFIGEDTSRVAWTHYRIPQTDSTQANRPLVVHCAGNAGDRYNSGAGYAAKALPWADVLVFDYPGYGDTPGPTSSAAFEAAASGISAYVTSLSAQRKLVFWGHSLGGFVCSKLAADVAETDGLILETTAPNAAAVARAWVPSYARPFVRTSITPSLTAYDVVDAAAKVKGPILVLGATKDEVLPVSLARNVGDGLKARGVNVIYQEFLLAGHQSVPYQTSFSQTVDAFFQSIEKPNP